MKEKKSNRNIIEYYLYKVGQNWRLYSKTRVWNFEETSLWKVEKKQNKTRTEGTGIGTFWGCQFESNLSGETRDLNNIS